MAKLNNKKIKWALKKIISKELSIKQVSDIYEVTPRHFQYLVKKYKETGVYPVMNKERRPKISLTENQKELIDKALKECYYNNAIHLRLFIKKKYNKSVPKNKLHHTCLRKELLSKRKRNKSKGSIVDMKEIIASH